MLNSLMFFMTTFSLSVNVVATSELLFVESANLANYEFERYILREVKTESMVSCAMQCLSSTDCLSVQMRMSSSECKLFSVVYFTTHRGIHSNGWKYYQNKGGRCPGYFADRRMHPECFVFVGNMNYFDGTQICRNIGAEIIRIDSEMNEDFIEIIADTFTETDFYLQGTWNGTHWIFDNQDVIVYTKWAPDQPGMSNEKLISIKLKRNVTLNERMWYSARQVNPKAVICTRKYH